MKAFVLGIVATLVVFCAIGLIIAYFGLVPTNADATPPAFETDIASHALDAAMDRSAPRLTNPLPASDDNVIDGMKIYTMNCAVCHGAMDLKPSVLEHSMYPPPPQLLLDPLDDPEWHIFYAIRTGVRYTGMPAWNKALSEQDMWKLTAFLSRVEKLSPATLEYWKKSYGVAPDGHAGEEHAGHEHHE